MKIEVDKCVFDYDVAGQRLKIIGTLRLNTMQEEYQIVNELLDKIITDELTHLTLQLQDLDFLNSLGISILSKFIIRIRETQRIKVTMFGSHLIRWQGKSLRNLKRLMPSIELQWI